MVIFEYKIDFQEKKKHNPRFLYNFWVKKWTFSKKLLEIIELGFIRYKNSDNACVIVVSSVSGLKKNSLFNKR